MPEIINTVIFDLDGTLLDTLDDLTAAVNHALRAFGLAASDKARVRRYVGDGVPKLIERSVYFAVTGKEPSMSEKTAAIGRLFPRALPYLPNITTSTIPILQSRTTA